VGAEQCRSDTLGRLPTGVLAIAAEAVGQCGAQRLAIECLDTRRNDAVAATQSECARTRARRHREPWEERHTEERTRPSANLPRSAHWMLVMLVVLREDGLGPTSRALK